MALTHTPEADLGLPAPDFLLRGVDGRDHSLESCRGANGLLVMFICNHCPYVKAIHQRLVEDCRELQRQGIGCIAIMPNDTERYPADSFDNMILTAEQWNLPFPYVIDTTQEVARAYGAVCTPDFFGFDKELKLRYRGRLDPYGPSDSVPDERQRELLNAMSAIGEGGDGPREQIPSMGCSIKWA
ncbi:MAG: thioredoxin family protein [Xanthomonadales bacterium]|nr:thioredoxin family protein [Xanthomonadales bacterium]